MVQRSAAEIVDPVRLDRPPHFRPRQALEVGRRDVDDFEVPGRDVGEEGRALGRPLGFGDVEEPVGERPFAGFVFGGGVYGRRVWFWCCHDLRLWRGLVWRGEIKGSKDLLLREG